MEQLQCTAKVSTCTCTGTRYSTHKFTFFRSQFEVCLYFPRLTGTLLWANQYSLIFVQCRIAHTLLGVGTKCSQCVKCNRNMQHCKHRCGIGSKYWTRFYAALKGMLGAQECVGVCACTRPPALFPEKSFVASSFVHRAH